MRRVLREPLLHFILIGAVVFLLFGLVGDEPAGEAPERIVVTADATARLAEQFQAVWRRPPTLDELSGLVDQYIEEEVYVREALALGLDRDDAVIRQRLRQKMVFLTESAVGALEPADDELRAFFEAHVERFTPAPRIAFRQVWIGETADAGTVSEVLGALADGAPPAALGRQTLLPAEMPLAAPATVDGTFGPGFFAAVAALSPGAWSAPVESAFGVHAVRLEQRLAAEPPAFDDVRERVLVEWRGERAAALNEAAYERMRQTYQISRPDREALAAILP